jgi:diguanylate cyclase (GGDEF)-like protein
VVATPISSSVRRAESISAAVIVNVALALAGVGAVLLALRERRRRRALERELDRVRTQVRVAGPTQLGNRQAFTEALEVEVSRCTRTGRPASLLVINLDSELWRGQADSCAQEALAEVIRTQVRGEDIGYQIGYDEFALILPETRGQGALVAASRIEAQFLASGGREGSLTIGIAELGPGIDRHQLFRNAYCAMLAADRDGLPRLVLYSPEFDHPSSGGVVDLAGFEALDGPLA